MGSLNSLKFQIPDSILGDYPNDPLNAGLFDEDNNLVLPIQREDYNPEDNSESGVVIGWQKSFVNFTFDNYKFEATSRDSRQSIYYILKSLQSACEQQAIINPSAYPLVTCIDYHNDWNYQTQSRSPTGFVVRQGVIKVSLINGSFTESISNPALMKWGGGVKIKFTEIF